MDDDTEKELIKGSVELASLAYNDALQPLAKETGKALGTVGKLVNIALKPLEGAVWGYSKIEDYVIEKVSTIHEKRGVNPEDIITPDPDVAVPAIEAMRYTKLKEQYAGLIASSMSKKTANDVHPAFVEILKQLSSDEAKIIESLIPNKGPLPVIFLKTAHGGGETWHGLYYGDKKLRAKCDFCENMERYINNLCRLGILELTRDSYIVKEDRYDFLLSLPEVKKHLGHDETKWKERYAKGLYKFTELGLVFKHACRVGG